MGLQASQFNNIGRISRENLDNMQHCLHWAMWGQHCANAVALYWANEQTALGIWWMPMLAHHCRQYWANIGPTLALYTTTLGHAWLPILGQHCANAVALYWANGNEQTALGLCWVRMLAHHCCQYWANIGPTLALYTTTLGHA